MKKIFVRFTIKGDELDINQLSQDVCVNADTYVKGWIYPHKFNGNPKPQKTNRWVYSLESESTENVNDILSRLFVNLSPFLEKINVYTKKFYAVTDIVVYADETSSTVNLNLSKKSIAILHGLNSKISFSVIDF